MTDIEIYELAASVTGVITRDLSEGPYKQFGGSLSMGWSDVPHFNARAESSTNVTDLPQHKIVFHYELARQLYRDAELYLDFVERYQDERLLPLFSGLEFASELPKFFPRDDAVRNMFIGALTWIYFHELAHLWQEHGYIRRRFGEIPDATTQIDECDAEGVQRLQGKNAALSHVTELAADFEATNTCLIELIRHFADDAIQGKPQDLKPFRAALYLLTSGISCACYRFYGMRPMGPEPFPSGSHPTPIRRLEFAIPNMFEFLDITSFHGMDRRQLVTLCGGAAYSAGFYFLGWLKGGRETIPENYMLRGLQNEPNAASYWGAIVDVWDEIEPTIKSIRRSGASFSLLRFTDDFRSKVLDPYVVKPTEAESGATKGGDAI